MKLNNEKMSEQNTTKNYEKSNNIFNMAIFLSWDLLSKQETAEEILKVRW